MLLPVKSSPRPYHHGNLRQALLVAAEAALESGGIQALSLRELSRELGVSHASPQRHFASKQALVDALAIVGFERLDAIMAKVAEAPGLEIKARLTKAAVAYVGFALKHPRLYALLFEAKHQPVIPPDLLKALLAYTSHLPKMLKEAQDDGKIIDQDPVLLALTFGATIHGLVALSMDGQLKGHSLKSLLPGAVEHLLSGIGTNKSPAK
jgi:AcrR family transcriptional regulator